MQKVLTPILQVRKVNYTLKIDGERSIEVQLEDIIKQSEEQGIQRMARMVCYNIALHQDPLSLTGDQARAYVFKMKKLLSAHYLQTRSRS